MNNQVLLFCFLILFTFSLQAQSPTLQVIGSSPSLSKGNINTEVLTAIIQQKQEEIKERVFRNTIVKQFNLKQHDYTRRLNNFATYYYLYNVMDVLTSGKNKTAMTRALVEQSTEFAFVIGTTYFVNRGLLDSLDVSTRVQAAEEGLIELKGIDAKRQSKGKKRRYDLLDPRKDQLYIPTDKISTFNKTIDLCYKILLEKGDTLGKVFKFNFKESLKDFDFENWFEADNKFDVALSEAKSEKEIESLKNLESYARKRIDTLLAVTLGISNTLDGIINSDKSTSLSQEAKMIFDKMATMTGDELKSSMKNIIDKYGDVLGAKQKEKLIEFTDKITSRYQEFIDIYQFYVGLKKSTYKDFVLTRAQFQSLKLFLTEFTNIAKNYYPNNSVATVIKFLLENSIVEYNDNSGQLISEATAKTSGNTSYGYLYIDVESLISGIDQRFTTISNSGAIKYIAPFFSMGVNYASFRKPNTLITDDNGDPASISNLYFASEKIGVRWKLWNWKYTHSYPAGAAYKYYGRNIVWNRPQKEPFVSNIHIIAYCSGLLYNVANLKSEKSFDYVVGGVGAGITLFNGLSANITLASPIIDKKFKAENSYFNFGVDIPIFEYIAALRNKKIK